MVFNVFSTYQEELMSKLLSMLLAAVFATVAVTPVLAAEKKEAKKVDCKDVKNKNLKECKQK
jgi:hypothetical protein